MVVNTEKQAKEEHIKNLFSNPTCLLCGANGDIAFSNLKDWEYLIIEKFNFYKCTQCNFLFGYPLPEPGKVRELYPDTYHNFSTPTNPISQFLQDRYYRHHVSICQRYLPNKNDSFLEIGSAAGHLLDRLRGLGYRNLQGIEISDKGCEVARSKGLQVFRGTLEEFKSATQFDMIYMSHVIEHVIDPANTIQIIRDLLRPGGVLYIETPNACSLDAKFWKGSWGLVHYPRHFYLFDPISLRRIIESSGLEVVRCWFELNSCGWALSVQNFLRSLRIDKSKEPRSFYYPFLLLAFLPLNLLDLLFGGTAFMAAVARKRR